MTGSARFQQQLRDIVGNERAGEIRRLILNHFAENERAENDSEVARTTNSSADGSASPADHHSLVDTASIHVNHAATLVSNPPAPQSHLGNYGTHLQPTQLPFVPELSHQPHRQPHSLQGDSGFMDGSLHESPFGASPNPFQQNVFPPFSFNNNMHGASQGYAASTPGMTMPYAVRGPRQERNHSTPGFTRVAHSAHAPGVSYDGTRNHLRPENMAWGGDLGLHDIPTDSHTEWRTNLDPQGPDESSQVQWSPSFTPQDPTDPSNGEV